MKNHPNMNGNHAPIPAHSTVKTCYQGRMGVSPTRTPAMAFNSTMEDGMRALEGGMQSYTSINDREPTPMEKGYAPNQKSMGVMNNGFKDNI